MTTTTVLFDATRPIARPRRFAAGLLAPAPTTLVKHTAADEAAWTQILADLEQARRDFDQHLEERATYAAQLDRMAVGPWL